MNSEILKNIIQNFDSTIEVYTYFNSNKLSIIDNNRVFREDILPVLIKSNIEFKIELYNYGIELDVSAEFLPNLYNQLNNFKRWDLW